MAIELKDIEEKAKTEIIDNVIFGKAKKVDENAVQIRNFLWKSDYIHYEFLIDKTSDKIAIEIHLEHDDVKYLYDLLLTSFKSKFQEESKFTDCHLILDPTWRSNRGRLRLIPNTQDNLHVIISTMSSFISETEKRINEELNKSFDIDNFIKDFINFSNQQTIGQGVVDLDNFNSKYSNKIYKNLKVEYSVGKGRASNTSWVSFLNYNQKTSKGIYPCIHYDKTNSKLNLLYDVSKKTIPEKNWSNDKNNKLFKEYDVNNILNGSESIKNDLDEIIDEYHLVFEEGSNSEKNKIEVKKEENIMPNEKKQPLNQILYGPPGTGKTYNTINKSIEIINPSFFDESRDRSEIKNEFDRLFEEGRINFTTFHQSMSYEDFIEGIKPEKTKENDSFLSYYIESGIFKSICNNAKTISVKKDDINWDVDYYKMSVGGKNRSDVHDWCLENNTIALGWGGNEDLSHYKNITDFNEYKEKFKTQFPDLVEQSPYNIQATFAFINMKENDIVIISKGNKIIDAIGTIKGQYYWSDSNPIDYFHYRKVEWVVKGISSFPERFLKKNISQMTIYKISNDDIKKDSFKEITENSDSNIEKPFVLIIDEINRGNVSQIFGELITLIEEDKRLGNKEALEVTLPYSKEKFGVPSNLYIIGTMNTADRSVEALDTALRRRFTFEEMPPRYDLDELKTKIDDFELSDILKTINKRIEKLLDKDHLIGHSFFINVKTPEELRNTFYKNIIPLLQEYFFGDYGKIGLILGSGFVSKKENNNVFSNFEYDETESLNEKVIYEIIDYRNDASIDKFKDAIKNLVK